MVLLYDGGNDGNSYKTRERQGNSYDGEQEATEKQEQTSFINFGS
jgi:hypothetical protein